MKFTQGRIEGVMVIDLEVHPDERGSFTRTWCAREFEQAGLTSVVAQTSSSINARRFTLRGMHWQAAPHGECKIVRCARGAIHDVLLDLRPTSPTYLEHSHYELDERNHRCLFVPPGVAHGFLTLTDDTEVTYQMDTFYVPEAARGVRWDDPAFAIEWPATPEVISPRDATYPDYAGDLVGTAHR